MRIEYLLGRRQKFTQAPRTVDLDLLFYGDSQIDSAYLQIPHKRISERRFVLVPLAELAPHFVHPVEDKTIQELLEDCEDYSAVTRWNPNSELTVEEILEVRSFSKAST